MKRKASMPHSTVGQLLSMLQEAYQGPAWHGPSLRSSLRGVGHEELFWRPGPGRHNLWEIAIHTAFWKYEVCRRLRRDKARTFPLKGRNWFEKSGNAEKAPDIKKAWKRDLALLSRMHEELLAVVSLLKPNELVRPSIGGLQTPRRLIAGIAFHDVYHAGQIQLVRKLAKTQIRARLVNARGVSN